MSSADRPAPVLVAGWVGSSNLGDELLYRALSSQLGARGAAPVAISTAPEATRATHDTGAVGHLDPVAWWRTLGSGGRAVFGGGGLLQDESSRLNVPYHLSRIAVARSRGARVVAVGLGGGRLHGPSEALIRTALRGVPVGARDDATVRQLRALGLDVRLTADLAFSLPRPEPAVRDELVVSLRPRNVGAGWRPAADAWHAGLPTADQAAAVAQRLEELALAAGLRLRFVALQADRDGVLHRHLAERITRVEVSCVEPSVDTVLAEIGRGRLVLAMRFHAAVAGLLSGRPVLAAAYSSKVAELAVDAPRSVQLVEAPLPGLSLEAVEGALDGDADARETEVANLVARERGNGALLDHLLEGVTGR